MTDVQSKEHKGSLKDLKEERKKLQEKRKKEEEENKQKAAEEQRLTSLPKPEAVLPKTSPPNTSNENEEESEWEKKIRQMFTRSQSGT